MKNTKYTKFKLLTFSALIGTRNIIIGRDNEKWIKYQLCKLCVQIYNDVISLISKFEFIRIKRIYNFYDIGTRSIYIKKKKNK